MIDLNSNEFNTSKPIFNNGQAGLVEGVDIAIEKRAVDEPENRPDYKLIVTDETGAVINEGFYYPQPNPQKTEEANQKYAKLQINRVLQIAKVVMGKDYVFPEVNSTKEAFDVLFKLVKENASNHKYNVYVTFGTLAYPNKKGYLSLRFFDFIERAGEKPTLFKKPSDLMEKLIPDTDEGVMKQDNPVQDVENWS